MVRFHAIPLAPPTIPLAAFGAARRSRGEIPAASRGVADWLRGGLQSRQRGFDSLPRVLRGGRGRVAMAPGCGPGKRGFESHRSPLVNTKNTNSPELFLGMWRSRQRAWFGTRRPEVRDLPSRLLALLAQGTRRRSTEPEIVVRFHERALGSLAQRTRHRHPEPGIGVRFLGGPL